MKVIFICKTCESKKEFTGVKWITRKDSNNGWIINFIEHSKKNEILFDEGYTLDNVEMCE